jgi:hypothetical protein
LSWSIAVARLTVKELVVSEGIVFEPAAADDEDDEDVEVEDEDELEDDDEQPAATRATAATPATQPSRERHPPCLLLPISIPCPFHLKYAH